MEQSSASTTESSLSSSDTSGQGRDIGDQVVNSDLGDHKHNDPALGCQIRPELTSQGLQTYGKINPPSAKQRDLLDSNTKCIQCKYDLPLYEIQTETLHKLKDSTKKLLFLIEQIQQKTHTNNIPDDETDLLPDISLNTKPDNVSIKSPVSSGSNIINLLETQTKALDAIYIEQAEDDDCSIYKRLTRKCHCLNHQDYNDFIIHFNEDTKHFTTNLGEIIKNMKILKKFLYMGGGYTKNCLLFLNEGLRSSTFTEKTEIVVACSHSDICNVFEECSIVTVLIVWPFKYENCGDSVTQRLTAEFLYKVSQVEEGRRYLNMRSKILNDIKRLVRKKGEELNDELLEALNATMNILQPPLANCVNVTYYCKPYQMKGVGNKTLTALIQYREYMTVSEILTHLDLLFNLSKQEKGKLELVRMLPPLCSLFKRILVENDNSEINIVITQILDNIITRNMLESAKPVNVSAKGSISPSKNKTVTNTEYNSKSKPITKYDVIEMPSKERSNKKKHITLGMSHHKERQPSQQRITDYKAKYKSPYSYHIKTKCKKTIYKSTQSLNRSRTFTNDPRNSVIIVPIE